MVTHAFRTYRLEKFWDDKFKSLPYINEPFNDPDSVAQWIAQGFQSKITGDLADMRGPQPLLSFMKVWVGEMLEQHTTA